MEKYVTINEIIGLVYTFFIIIANVNEWKTFESVFADLSINFKLSPCVSPLFTASSPFL